jgi:hypothetical protein
MPPSTNKNNNTKNSQDSTTIHHEWEEESLAPSTTTAAAVTPQQLNRKQQKAKDAQEEQKYLVKLQNWQIMLKQKIAREFFHRVQMFCNGTQTGYGSKWQKVCCKTTEVPKKYREKFWVGVGQALAANQIWLRRINTCTAMKKEFLLHG